MDIETARDRLVDDFYNLPGVNSVGLLDLVVEGSAEIEVLAVFVQPHLVEKFKSEKPISQPYQGYNVVYLPLGRVDYLKNKVS